MSNQHEPSEPRDIAELVQFVRAYGDSGYEGTNYRSQLHERYPWMIGWWNAAQYLQRLHTERFWAARGGFDPWSTEDPGTDPGYAALMDIYNRALTDIADGHQPTDA
jgi:hypothetical protein